MVASIPQGLILFNVCIGVVEGGLPHLVGGCCQIVGEHTAGQSCCLWDLTGWRSGPMGAS